MKGRNLYLALLITACAAIVSLDPALASLAIYDRRAVLDGEAWRLFTAPLMHFTPTHFGYDVIVLIVAAVLIARRGYRGYGWVCGVTPPLTSLAVLALEPRLAFCGGLSGVATGALVLLALHGLREPGAWRWVCAGTLLATGGKTVFEAVAGRFAFISVDPTQVKPVLLCHLGGILVGAAAFGLDRFLVHHAAGQRFMSSINLLVKKRLPS